MARCWTCGEYVASNSFTCNSCKQLHAHELTKSAIKEAASETSGRLEVINSTLLDGFDRLTDVTGEIADHLSGIASTLEWGFDAVVWQLQQQNTTLQSIGVSLRTPSATQANEWREIADDLTKRGVFSQAKEFYLKALEAYPLDYRTYLGLAATYLKTDQFDQASNILEQSLPHAPSEGGFDWKSHSYRLLGHIHACREDYQNAARLLGLAIGLSPNSAEVHYDNALYCAQIGDSKSVKRSLAFAIERSPKLWRTSAVAREFRPMQPLVEQTRAELLKDARALHTRAVESARNAYKPTSSAIARAEMVNSRLRQLRIRPGDDSWGSIDEPLQCQRASRETYDLLARVSSAKLEDYIECLEVTKSAEKVNEMAARVLETANQEHTRLLGRLSHARAVITSERSHIASQSRSIRKILTVLAYFLGSLGGCISRVKTVPGHPVSIFYPIEAYITVGPLFALSVAIFLTIIGQLRLHNAESLPEIEDLS